MAPPPKQKIEVSPMKLMDGFDSNYRYVHVVARRARQLAGGAPPLVDTNARKTCRIAREEIAAGKVPYTVKVTAAPGETQAGDK